jgi:hypothetical protein
MRGAIVTAARGMFLDWGLCGTRKRQRSLAIVENDGLRAHNLTAVKRDQIHARAQRPFKSQEAPSHRARRHLDAVLEVPSWHVSERHAPPRAELSEVHWLKAEGLLRRAPHTCPARR